MQRPIILITLDIQYGSKDGYSNRDWYCLRADYSRTIRDLGGTPFLTPYSTPSIKHYLEIADGIIFSGSDSNIRPETYGEKPIKKLLYNELRFNFESILMSEALKTNIPMLGICAGEQLMNVVCGGTLIQHIPEQIPNALNHKSTDANRAELVHNITIDKNTKLFEIIGETEIVVNSTHNQAVKTTGKNIKISATAKDGVHEAIEHTNKEFCIGVEWHPELHSSKHDTKIFTAFMEAVKKYKQNKYDKFINHMP
ncbi:putative glutamine amidotransferase [Candidatus Xenohaliotis californiensis]|uniref:Glutamine amidotransferase n=1 Tax=Candidatus Xenohaliotis californiensis TaxID=84677 RepID=A0ABP0ESP0_9RICK|nr:putative glutamine amidotransferase [Candidatus Xenohaliotis californiensis]